MSYIARTPYVFTPKPPISSIFETLIKKSLNRIQSLEIQTIQSLPIPPKSQNQQKSDDIQLTDSRKWPSIRVYLKSNPYQARGSTKSA